MISAISVLIVVSAFFNVRQNIDRYWRKRLSFAARLDDRDAGPRDREYPRGRLRAGDGDVCRETAIGSLAPQLVANRPGITEQAIEPAHVDDDEAAVRFIPRRKLLRDNG